MFLDCEHFFDGYASRPRLRRAGARGRVRRRRRGRRAVRHQRRHAADRASSGSVAEVLATGPASGVGIHCQDDTGCAVANTLAAVEAGVTHVQCTANGYGERAGNADLFAVVGNLRLKLGLQVLPDGLPGGDDAGRRTPSRRSPTSRPNTHQAYVGSSAFAHKAGLHASAIKVDPGSTTTSTRRSSATTCGSWSPRWPAGRRIELKGRELGVDLAGRPEARRPGRRRGQGAARPTGWSFEAADASFELLRPRRAGRGARRARRSRLESLPGASSSTASDGAVVSEATVKVQVGGRAVDRDRRGQRPGQRPRRRAAAGAVRALPAAARRRAGRLQGPHPRGQRRHRLHHPGSRLVGARQRAGVDDGRRARQRRGGVLAGPGRRPGLRARSGRPAGLIA